MGSYGNRYWDTGWWHGIREYDDFLGSYKWYVGKSCWTWSFSRKIARLMSLDLSKLATTNFQMFEWNMLSCFKGDEPWWTICMFGFVQDDILFCTMVNHHQTTMLDNIVYCTFFPKDLKQIQIWKTRDCWTKRRWKLRLEPEQYHCNPFISQQRRTLFLRSSPIGPT